MYEFTILRHGQANFEAKNEEDYDRLSPRGQKQAEKLGQFLSSSTRYGAIIHGSMRRQRQTAEAANTRGLPTMEDPRLNELDYFGMAQSVSQRRGIKMPDSAEAFFDFMVILQEDWENGNMCPHLEPYADFKSRVSEAVRDAAMTYDRPLLVSSGGVIGTLAYIALGGSSRLFCRLMSEVSHTSLNRFRIDPKEATLRLRFYAATPHLEDEGDEWVTYA